MNQKPDDVAPAAEREILKLFRDASDKMKAVVDQIDAGNVASTAAADILRLLREANENMAAVADQIATGEGASGDMRKAKHLALLWHILLSLVIFRIPESAFD